MAVTSAMVKSNAWQSDKRWSYPAKTSVFLSCFLKKIVELAFLALIIAAQCALNSLKVQLRFAYCTLSLQIAFFAAKHF
jgi:hypothetical protein